MFNRKGPKEPDPINSTVSFQTSNVPEASDPEEQFEKTADFNPNSEPDPLATNLLSYNRRSAYPDLPDGFASEDGFEATEEIERDETTEFIQVEASEEKEARTVLLNSIPDGFAAKQDPARADNQTALQNAIQTAQTPIPAIQTEPIKAITGKTETTSATSSRTAQRDVSKAANPAIATNNGTENNTGAPVVAESQTPRRRLHMIAVVAMMVILFTVTVGGACYFWQKSEQSKAIMQISQEIDGVANALQSAYLMPLHDIRREQVMAKERLSELAQRLGPLDSADNGRGRFALGRALLVAQDYDRAQEQLTLAWQRGYRSPDLSQALGRVMAEIYFRQLARTEQIDDQHLRDEQVKNLQKSYREPALQHLQTAAAQHNSPLLQSWIALMQEKPDEALKQAEEAFKQTPTLYEAKWLAGNIYLMLAKEKRGKSDLTGAGEDYQQARLAYQQAIDIARSNASIYEQESARSLQELALAVQQKGTVNKSFEQTLTACDRALQANPDNHNVHNLRARAYWQLGEYQLAAGEDPCGSLERSIEITEKLAANNNGKPDANLFLTKAKYHHMKAEWMIKSKVNPADEIKQGLVMLDKALAINPNLGDAVALKSMMNVVQSYITTTEFSDDENGSAESHDSDDSDASNDAHTKDNQAASALPSDQKRHCP